MKVNTDHSQESPIPSATVILLREGDGGVETLLVRRQPGTAPFAGAWVFPGGAIEAADGSAHPGDAWPEAARRAAVRELREEAGLDVMTHELVPFSCWTSPTVVPQRFRTWFFSDGRAIGADSAKLQGDQRLLLGDTPAGAGPAPRARHDPVSAHLGFPP